MAIKRGAHESVTGEYTAWATDTDTNHSVAAPGFHTQREAIEWTHANMPDDDVTSDNAGCPATAAAVLCGVIVVGLSTLPLWWA